MLQVKLGDQFNSRLPATILHCSGVYSLQVKQCVLEGCARVSVLVAVGI